MDFNLGHGDGIKEKDIKDVEKRTNSLIKSLMKLHDELIGKSPTDGLVNLTRVVIRDPAAQEFRQKLDKLIAKIASMLDGLMKEIVQILKDLSELSQAGHDVLFIKDEDRYVQSLQQGFAIINDRLIEMQRELKNLLQIDAMDKESMAMQIINIYIGVVEELKLLHPVEEHLKQLYKVVDKMV